ncbi:MAG TPA: ATP-binding protein, partial [Ferruginibacter sp.]|nr:ATP-binding protein [Ferruginibacter sp.]
DFNEKKEFAKITITGDCFPKMHGYQKLLSLLFHHLIDNAIKFRKEDTCVSIVISCKGEDGEKIENPAAFKGSRYNVISISDDGIGFDGKHVESIFKLFTRLNEKHRYKGSGIGLAVCKKIMDLHHGFINAESTEGEGTIFHCYFPS